MLVVTSNLKIQKFGNLEHAYFFEISDVYIIMRQTEKSL